MVWSGLASMLLWPEGIRMVVESITEAKAQLSALIQKVQDGEPVIIKKAGKPVAILNAYAPAAQQRKPGAMEGRITIADDFDQLPADIASAFGMDRAT